MQKTITILFLVISTSSFAQKSGTLSFGVNYAGNFTNLKGFSSNLGLNVGKFYAKNLVVGLSSNLTLNRDTYNRYTKLYSDYSNTNEGINSYKNNTLTFSLFSRYYISDYRFRPFLFAELGSDFNFQKSSVFSSILGSESNKSNNFGINYAFGLGFSYAVNKKKSITIEGSMLLNNSEKFQSLINNSYPIREQELKPEIRIGIQFSPFKR